MSDINRTIEKLLDDYSEALRDGCIPTFLKSLTREEAKRTASSRQLQDATEMVRILNSVAFADKAATPKNLDSFISHVNAEIASRLKRTKALSRGRRGTRTKPVTKMGNNGKPI